MCKNVTTTKPNIENTYEAPVTEVVPSPWFWFWNEKQTHNKSLIIVQKDCDMM